MLIAGVVMRRRLASGCIGCRCTARAGGGCFQRCSWAARRPSWPPTAGGACWRSPRRATCTCGTWKGSSASRMPRCGPCSARRCRTSPVRCPPHSAPAGSPHGGAFSSVLSYVRSGTWAQASVRLRSLFFKKKLAAALSASGANHTSSGDACANQGDGLPVIAVSASASSPFCKPVTFCADPSAWPACHCGRPHHGPQVGTT